MGEGRLNVIEAGLDEEHVAIITPRLSPLLLYLLETPACRAFSLMAAETPKSSALRTEEQGSLYHHGGYDGTEPLCRTVKFSARCVFKNHPRK